MFKKENQEFCSDSVNLRCLFDISLEMLRQWQWIYMSESSVKRSECGGINNLLTKAAIEGRWMNVVLIVVLYEMD